MPPWLTLMIDALPSLLWACILFTVPLTLLSFVLGLGVGFFAAVIRLFAPAPFAWIIRFYVWIIRGTPLMLQILDQIYVTSPFTPAASAAATPTTAG